MLQVPKRFTIKRSRHEVHMPPYCISSVFSRRDFLKLLLALAGLTLALNTPGQTKSIHPASGQAPVWWWDLQTGKMEGPGSTSPVPYGMPGSVMKLVTATALLEDGLMAPHQRFTCNGHITFQGKTYVCAHAHGSISLVEALGRSCNVYFAQAVRPLSAQRLWAYARRFQLDRPVTSNAPFQFMSPALGHQPIQDLALGLSPAMQPNALQLLRVAKIIAQREISGLNPSTWDVLQGGMRFAARRGTAQALDPSDQYQFAAKTGTAPHGERFNSWLIGYFPFEKPRYAFCARASAGTASDSAVPLMRHFLAQREPF
jgi:cell division protein FtsI/penicillin-binding protein 2